MTPQGDVSVAQWVSFWSELHGNLSDVGFAWDAWMHHSMTYYVPELTPFLAKWAENGTPFLARKYPLVYSGNDTSVNVTVFSAFVNLPHSGQIIEIISPACTQCGESADFRDFEPAACPASATVNRTVVEMDMAWNLMGGSQSNGNDLPDLLVVKLSQPTETPGAMSDYLREFATTNFTVTRGAVRYADGATAAPRTCEFATARMRMYYQHVDWDVEVRAVRNPLASGGLRGVAATGRDAKRAQSNAERLATFSFSALEILVFLLVAAFALVGLLAYFLALEGGAEVVTEGMSRWLYYSSNILYFLAVALAGRLMYTAAHREGYSLRRMKARWSRAFQMGGSKRDSDASSRADSRSSRTDSRSRREEELEA